MEDGVRPAACRTGAAAARRAGTWGRGEIWARGERANFTRLVLGARAVRIPDKSSKTDGTGSSLPDLDKKTVTLRSLD